ncbi:ribosomal biogenesis protein LAS1L-like isoform X1 [Phoenix dactylifera]|uniref:Ribosomal biogenesis protein LAS1L-like isoform X1 n=2 Tax=Phoenix dactylifera TaxID=42345 RepID=A0A8B9AFF3_PHODC|nr:ribosomal biogenesis protein LAS1L-like isoform X1 [Phoenix dactylifera]
MTIQPEFNGSENLEFSEFYKKTHTKKNKEWIDPICAVKHSKMLSLREESSQSGVQLTSEEMSRQALGKRKRYILGFGDGPKPSSSSSTPSRVSQDHVGELQKLKAEMEEMKMEREMEREELRRQLEQERREREEEKKEREEEQKQIAHLTSLVTEFLKEKTQTHKSSIHHDGAMYSTGGTNTRWYVFSFILRRLFRDLDQIKRNIIVNLYLNFSLLFFTCGY